MTLELWVLIKVGIEILKSNRHSQMQFSRIHSIVSILITIMFKMSPKFNHNNRLTSCHKSQTKFIMIKDSLKMCQKMCLMKENLVDSSIFKKLKQNSRRYLISMHLLAIGSILVIWNPINSIKCCKMQDYYKLINKLVQMENSLKSINFKKREIVSWWTKRGQTSYFVK